MRKYFVIIILLNNFKPINIIYKMIFIIICEVFSIKMWVVRF